MLVEFPAVHLAGEHFTQDGGLVTETTHGWFRGLLPWRKLWFAGPPLSTDERGAAALLNPATLSESCTRIDVGNRIEGEDVDDSERSGMARSRRG